ncbi:uncharacterized protein LOC134277724 [Saccostrea cucullata]|uniref:uncharacterized protein LOC134277724 n=1 Tax=Saccostrea cuccullata TaxID=36930 RepID=UPI002ECFFB22
MCFVRPNTVGVSGRAKHFRVRRGVKGGRRFIRRIHTVCVGRLSYVEHQLGANRNNLVYIFNDTLNNSCPIAKVPNETCETFPIPTLIQHRKKRIDNTSCRDGSNLLKIETSRVPIANTSGTLSLCTLNCRSSRNKSVSINDYIQSNNIDLMVLTETWLGSNTDNAILSELTPNGYNFTNNPRVDRRGGGLAIIHEKQVSVKPANKDAKYTNFEHLECSVGVKNKFIRIAVIYRPPPSKSNKFKNSVFFEEWTNYLDSLVLIPGELLITGVLNFHLDDPNDKDARTFTELLTEHGLKQHISDETHRLGHTLDVLITREDSPILQGTPFVADPGICDNNGNRSGDHLAIRTLLRLSKAPRERRTVTFRKIHDINIDKFRNDLDFSNVTYKEASVEKLIIHYNRVLTATIDVHAPQKSKEIVIRPNTPWFTDDLYSAKRDRRRAERTMRRTNLAVHNDIFNQKCMQVTKLIQHCKSQFYINKIQEIGSDSKQLFKLTNNLMGNTNLSVLPEHDSEIDLASKFGEFFIGKIQKIRENLCSLTKSPTMEVVLRADIKFDGIPLEAFEPVSIAEVCDIIGDAPTKSCELDPIPTNVLKQCLESPLPIVTEIINKSFSEASVPLDFKKAIVRPLIKGQGLDKDEFKNYRPVSNLPFLSKVLEKAVASRLEKHLNAYQLHDNVQSAY